MTADLPEKVVQSVDETRRSFLSKCKRGRSATLLAVDSGLSL
jgi:hypothetical protein